MRSQRIKQLGCHFTAVWEFHVNKRRAFEKAYGPEGDWAKLFGRAEGYIRTELIRDSEIPLRYVTLDFWTSRQAYQRFKKQNLAAYKILDKRCNSLTESERLIGEFDGVLPPGVLRMIGTAESKVEFPSEHKTFLIRLATPADIPAMIVLDREAASAAHWSEAAYRNIFQQDSPTRIALVGTDQNGVLQGFVIARTNGEDCELENIVVQDNARCKGMGSGLLQTLIAEISERGASRIFLEVRQSNAAARALYAKCGFEIGGHRKSYYSNPVEDAILYALTL